MSTVSSSIGSWLLAVDFLEHHARLGHGQLVAFAAHVFQQDGQVQFAAAGDFEDAFFVGVLHAQGHVGLQLTFAAGPRSGGW